MVALITPPQASRPVLRLVALAVLISLPAVAGVVWWNGRPAAKAPDPGEGYATRVRQAMVANRNIQVGDRITLPTAQGWVNPPTRTPLLGPGLTVVDITALW
ncbi:MAG: hypothetical protein NTV55_09975 [Planctomycetota bacterium]|nr:hypothetical protein [Planctomycetota bacterium]